MATTAHNVVSFSSVAAAVAMLLGILKACDEATEQKMISNLRLAEEKVRCVREIEALNEAWHERTGK